MEKINENVNANNAFNRLQKSNERLENVKNLILNGMVDYYGEEYREAISNCIHNINVHEWNNTEELKEIAAYEKYGDILYRERNYYDWLVNDKSEVKVREFILLYPAIVNTPDKVVYSLTDAYIKAFMSYNTLKYMGGYYGRNRGNIYMIYDSNLANTYVPTTGPVFFENTCTKFDACQITKNILKIDDIDFCYDYDDNLKRLYPLLDNEEVRDNINYARINHKYLNKLGDQRFDEVQQIINQAIPNTIIEEKIYEKRNTSIAEKEHDLNIIINELNYKYPSQKNKVKN